MAGFFQWLIQLKYVRACCCPGQDIDVGDLDIPYQQYSGDAQPCNHEAEASQVVMREPKLRASLSATGKASKSHTQSTERKKVSSHKNEER